MAAMGSVAAMGGGFSSGNSSSSSKDSWCARSSAGSRTRTVSKNSCWKQNSQYDECYSLSDRRCSRVLPSSSRLTLIMSVLPICAAVMGGEGGG